jgi:hypothetical protein
MSEVKLSSKLPGGDANGIAKILGELVKAPHKVQVLVALVDSQKSVTDHDTGDIVPVVRIRRVEVVRKQDLKEAERLIRRALEARTGETVLPLELEDEISAAFENIDFNELAEDETHGDDE